MWRIVSTWAFSLQCVRRGAEILSAGGKALDAAEQGIHLVETDPTVDCVGRGGYLNADGELALDAAVMDGDTLKMGVVACVRGFEHPVSIARAVMEKTPHSILVGPGAERFALEQGFTTMPDDYMITEQARRNYAEAKARREMNGHDTIGCVAMDPSGSMGAAISTCGSNMRLPGRVGDSPIIGSGFYVETGVGGATATGWGEDIMRTCMSFRAVELMRQGLTAQEAADQVILTGTKALIAKGLKPREMAVAVMDAKGGFGGAANHPGYAYARAGEGIEPAVVEVTPIINIREL